jgi:hypothetical protein
MEITLFDGNGRPVAYIADDNENSIYLWSGHAVAYINEQHVYGWNGKHLGWFIDGIIYNLQGQRVGTVREKCPSATYAEPAKYTKYAKYAKNAKYAPYAMCALSTGYSNGSFESFLKQGTV